ncbi:hypothetical protein BHE74_00052984, partial [Ensete ventricosum]
LLAERTKTTRGTMPASGCKSRHLLQMRSETWTTVGGEEETDQKHFMENSLVDSVIREMEQAFELTTKLQSLVELGNYSDTQKESARMVSRELLQTCNATLSMLKSRRTNVKIEYGSQYKLAPREVPIRRDRRRQ